MKLLEAIGQGAVIVLLFSAYVGLLWLFSKALLFLDRTISEHKTPGEEFLDEVVEGNPQPTKEV